MVGEFEDHISPETRRAQARVSSDMEKMAKSAGGFMKAVVGIVAIREIKQIFSEMINFASQHQTAVTNQINKMKSAYNSFMTGLVESPLFGQLIDRITEALSFAAVLLQNSAAWEAFLILIGAKWNLFIYGVKKSFIEAFSFNTDMISAMFDKNPGAIAAAMAKTAIADPVTKIMVEAADQAATDFNKAFDEGLKKLKVSAPIGEQIFLATKSSIAGITREVVKLNDHFTRLKFLKASVDIDPKPKVSMVDVPQGPGPGFMAKQSEIAGNTIANFMEIREQFQQLYSRDMPTFNEIASQTAEIISGGIANAFDSLGAAMARGQSAMGAFAKGMIAVAGQIAGSFGDMFIKLGIAALLINPAQGIALIAAGAALKVLAGFLGAKASGGAPSSAGGFSGPAPARDYSTGNSQRKTGDTIVNVHINGDVMTLDKMDTDKRFNELAMKIGKSLDRQTNTLDRGFV